MISINPTPAVGVFALADCFLIAFLVRLPYNVTMKKTFFKGSTENAIGAALVTAILAFLALDFFDWFGNWGHWVFGGLAIAMGIDLLVALYLLRFKVDIDTYGIIKRRGSLELASIQWHQIRHIEFVKQATADGENVIFSSEDTEIKLYFSEQVRSAVLRFAPESESEIFAELRTRKVK